MIIDTEKLERLIASDITGYRVSKLVNIKQQQYDKYKKGQTSIDSMTLKTAEELMELLKMKEGIIMTIRNIKNAINESMENRNGFFFWNAETNTLYFQAALPESGPGDNYFGENEYLLCWINENEGKTKRETRIKLAIKSLIATDYQFADMYR